MDSAPNSSVIFTSPGLVFHIFSFSSVTDLLNKYQKINSTVYKLVASDGYLLASCLRYALGMREQAQLELSDIPSQEEPTNLLQHPQIVSLLHLAKFCVKQARFPPPMQMFAFRSSIGSDEFWGDLYQIYNLATGFHESGFCSRESGPGCFSMIPFPYNNVKFQTALQDFQNLQDFSHSWKDSMSAIKHLECFVERGFRRKHKDKLLLNRFQDCMNQTRSKSKSYSWHMFQEWIHDTLRYAREVKRMITRPKEKVKQRPNIPLDQTIIEYNPGNQFRVMKDYLFSMFQFCIITTPSYTCNLKSFAILLHDVPLNVQDSRIYQIVSNWNSRARVNEALRILGNQIPPAYQEESTPVSYVRFFKQMYYNQHKSEEVRLVCWGELRNASGEVYFDLPSAVSSRFISLVGINTHNTMRRGMLGNHTNLDIHKFTPFGFIVPCI